MYDMITPGFLSHGNISLSTNCFDVNIANAATSSSSVETLGFYHFPTYHDLSFLVSVTHV
jgi:hypothetical protein